MIAATAPRATVGTGELSQALHKTRDRAVLNRFCSAHVCTPAEVSEDGLHLHLPSVLQLMRNRGYEISPPIKPQHQPKARQGLTAWIVHIRIRHVEFDLAFYTPIAAENRAANKPQPSRLEHA
jgi:hypothetical protein